MTAPDCPQPSAPALVTNVVRGAVLGARPLAGFPRAVAVVVTLDATGNVLTVHARPQRNMIEARVAEAAARASSYQRAIVACRPVAARRSSPCRSTYVGKTVPSLLAAGATAVDAGGDVLENTDEAYPRG